MVRITRLRARVPDAYVYAQLARASRASRPRQLKGLLAVAVRATARARFALGLRVHILIGHGPDRA